MNRDDDCTSDEEDFKKWESELDDDCRLAWLAFEIENA